MKRKTSAELRHAREVYKIVWRSYKRYMVHNCEIKTGKVYPSVRNNKIRNQKLAPIRRPYPKRHFKSDDFQFVYSQDITTVLFFKHSLYNIQKKENGLYELKRTCVFDNQMNISGIDWDNRKDCHRCIHASKCDEYTTCDINNKLRSKHSRRKNIIYDTNTVWECEAKEIIPDGIFIVENKDEMIGIVEKSRNFFSSPEDHEEFWGCNPNYDDDGIYTETIFEYAQRGGEIKYIPNSYPAAVFLRPQDCEHLVWHELKSI